MSNLILGIVSRMSLSKIELFFLSRKRHCGDNDCVIFAHDVSDTVGLYLRSLGVRVIDVRDVIDVKGHINETRWLFYERFLRETSGRYEKVFISDIRDVVFEGDVFCTDQEERFLCLAEEFGSFGSSKIYDELIKVQFGEDNFKKLHGNKVICAGTILGSFEEMLMLSQTFNHVMFGGVFPSFQRSDQSAYNHIIYSGLLPKCDVYYSRPLDGSIMTVGTASEKNLEDAINVINSRKTVKVVHQYDRWIDLIKKYRNSYQNEKYSTISDKGGLRDYVDMAYAFARNGDITSSKVLLEKAIKLLQSYSKTMKYIKWSFVSWNDVLPIYQAALMNHDLESVLVSGLVSSVVDILMRIPVGTMMLEDFWVLSNLSQNIDKDQYGDFFETIKRVHNAFIIRGDIERGGIMEGFGI